MSFFCSFLALFGACDSTTSPFADKWTAEERGYLTAFDPVLTAACNIGKTRMVSDGMQVVPSTCINSQGYADTCMKMAPKFKHIVIASLAESNVKAVDAVVDMQRTMAPDGMELLHAQLVGALEAEVKSPSQLTKSASAACSTYDSVAANILKRPKAPKTNESFFITYKPPTIAGVLGPSVSYSTRTGFAFSLDQSISIPTKYGSATLGYKSSPGVKALRVITGVTTENGFQSTLSRS